MQPEVFNKVSGQKLRVGIETGTGIQQKLGGWWMALVRVAMSNVRDESTSPCRIRSQ
jgi:hypothetical protein